MGSTQRLFGFDWRHWLRPLVVGVVLGAVLLGSVASVTASQTDKRTLTITWTTTSYVSTQADPTSSVFEAGDEIFLSASVHPDQAGTAALHCAVTGPGGATWVCDAAFTLPGGKIVTQTLFDLQTEVINPVRQLAITGGTGEYRGAKGVLTVTSLNDTDEMGVFSFDK